MVKFRVKGMGDESNRNQQLSSQLLPLFIERQRHGKMSSGLAIPVT
ncbi:MAG: hypothetical protein RIR52_161, partial [Acidobacteriota bacterium]